MNGDPSIRDLIAEAHAARAAGDHEQLRRALDELQRVTDAANQPEQDAAAAANPDAGARLAGGIAGAGEGVADIVKGTVGMGKRFFGLQTPEQTKQFLKDVVKAPMQAVQNIRDVTQQYRAGDASPEDVARTWTGGTPSVLGPALLALGASGIDASPRMSLMDPVRAGGRTIAQALRRTEGVVSPRNALYRLRLKQARAAAGRATAGPTEPSTPDVADESAPAGLTREALERAGVKPENVDHMLELQTRPPSAPEAQPISPGAPGTGMKAQAASSMAATAETMARVQRGPTKAQLAWRADRFQPGGTAPSPLQAASYADLRGGLESPATGAVLKQAILEEFRRRGIVGEGLLPPR